MPTADVCYCQVTVAISTLSASEQQQEAQLIQRRPGTCLTFIVAQGQVFHCWHVSVASCND